MNMKSRIAAFVSALLIVAALAAFSSATIAQDAATDDAKKLLQQGVSEYKALNFKQAQATFLKVNDLLKDNKTALADDEKKALDDYLAKVPAAIRSQATAQEGYRAAVKALEAGTLDDAIQGFAKAAASEYLDAATRQDAQAQLALAQKRKSVAAVATTAAAPGMGFVADWN